VKSPLESPKREREMPQNSGGYQQKPAHRIAAENEIHNSGTDEREVTLGGLGGGGKKKSKKEGSNISGHKSRNREEWEEVIWGEERAHQGTLFWGLCCLAGGDNGGQSSCQTCPLLIRRSSVRKTAHTNFKGGRTDLALKGICDLITIMKASPKWKKRGGYKINSMQNYLLKWRLSAFGLFLRLINLGDGMRKEGGEKYRA